jgi:hypothetical protein
MLSWILRILFSLAAPIAALLVSRGSWLRAHPDYGRDHSDRAGCCTDRARTAGAFLKTENLPLLNFRFGQQCCIINMKGGDANGFASCFDSRLRRFPDLGELGAIRDWIQVRCWKDYEMRDSLSFRNDNSVR